MRKIDLHLPMDNLRVSEHLIQPVDRCARHAHGLQNGNPMLGRLLYQMRIEQGDELITILKPIGVSDETAIGCQAA